LSRPVPIFHEASVVEARADITSLVAVYAYCPDFQKVYKIISALKTCETHDTCPSGNYSMNEAGYHSIVTVIISGCVLSSQRNLILRVMHDLPLRMHQGTAKMYGLMSSRFYVPKMAERVKAYVETCEHCQ
jgi:hypothetical protein